MPLVFWVLYDRLNWMPGIFSVMDLSLAGGGAGGRPWGTHSLRSEGVRLESDLAAAAKEKLAHQHDRVSIANRRPPAHCLGCTRAQPAGDPPLPDRVAALTHRAGGGRGER